MSSGISTQHAGTLALLKAKMLSVREEQEKLRDECKVKDSQIRNEIDAREKAELEGQEVAEKVGKLENYHEKLTKDLSALQSRLEESVRVADDIDRQRKVLENRTTLDEERITHLESNLRDAVESTNTAEKRLEELEHKVDASEKELDAAEERAQNAERRIKELEEEVKLVSGNLKSFEISREKAQSRETIMEQQIRLFTERLQDAQSRAEYAEQEAAKRLVELDKIDGQLRAERWILTELQTQIQAANATIDAELS